MTRHRFIYGFMTVLVLGLISSYKIPETHTLSENTTPFQILHQMMDSIDNIKTLKMKLVALERYQNKYLKAVSYTKISYYPIKKLYFINPEKKIEILYIENANDNKALVKHPSLPFSIFLDPSGSVMKKKQHYTIHELGFQYISHTIQMALAKEKNNYQKHLHYLGLNEKNNKLCYTLMYESSDFDFITYTVQSRETVVSIARKFNINEYILRDKNNLYSNYEFLKKGTSILIPTMYCKKAFIYLDKNNYLPVSINLYDDKGIIESYDYFEVQKNIPINDEEFTKNFKEYNF